MAKRKTPYRSKVKIGVDANGKAINKWIQGSTRAELDEQRRKVIAYYITGEGLGADRLFGEYAVEWYHVRKEPFISISTRKGYRSMLNRYILPEFAERHLRAIRPMDLQEFVNRFAGRSSTLLNNAFVILVGIFRAAKQDGLIRRDPTEGLIRPDPAPRTEKRALTPEERQRMIAIFPTHPDGLYLAVLYYTGMRPGEVRGLQWSDFDWETNLIHVRRDVDYAAGGVLGDLKTTAADRYVPIAAELRELLYPRRQAPAALVFAGRDGGPISADTALKMWVRLMVACGLAEEIPEKERRRPSNGIVTRYHTLITPHAMRHNFITLCWEAGMDILLTMRIVGHSDYEVTRKVYTHLSARHLDAARAKMDTMFGAKVAEKLHEDQKVKIE